MARPLLDSPATFLSFSSAELRSLADSASIRAMSASRSSSSCTSAASFFAVAVAVAKAEGAVVAGGHGGHCSSGASCWRWVSASAARSDASMSSSMLGAAAPVAAAGGGAAALAPVARYHVGDVVTALRRAALGAGGAEVVAYATVSGAVGALAPSPSRDDRDFFAHLEMHVRQERLAPTGRDHASYRSSYAPAKDVADGDLCAEFLALPADARRRVAADLDRTPADVAKKLEDARNRVL